MIVKSFSVISRLSSSKLRIRGGIEGLTARSTTEPKRRSRMPCSIDSSRSEASSSCNSMSASRSTRNGYDSHTSKPGKSMYRWAAITCSIHTNATVWAFSDKTGTGTRRGRLGGTFTRANRGSFSDGSVIETARFKLRFEICGNRWPGSTANGVNTGKISRSKYESIEARCPSFSCS